MASKVGTISVTALISEDNAVALLVRGQPDVRSGRRAAHSGELPLDAAYRIQERGARRDLGSLHVVAAYRISLVGPSIA